MARYTDIDKLITEYDRVHVGAPGGARKLMVEAPIADVVPRAEVAREIFEEIEREICLALESNYKARDRRQMIVIAHGSSTLDREFIEYVSGKIDTLRGINDFVAELKNKYAEGRNER